MKLIQYVGHRDSKTDNVARTGLVWTQGQVHPVTDEAAKKLLGFPSLWIEVPPHEETKAEAPPVLKRRPMTIAV